MVRVSEWVIVGIMHAIMVRVSELLLVSYDHGKSEWVIEDNSKWEIFSYTKKKEVALDDMMMMSALY
jgi:hypothetical protein